MDDNTIESICDSRNMSIQEFALSIMEDENVQKIIEKISKLGRELYDYVEGTYGATIPDIARALQREEE